MKVASGKGQVIHNSQFTNRYFQVSARRLPVNDYIPLRLPDRFLQSVADRMLYEYEQAYIFRFSAA